MLIVTFTSVMLGRSYQNIRHFHAIHNDNTCIYIVSSPNPANKSITTKLSVCIRISTEIWLAVCNDK